MEWDRPAPAGGEAAPVPAFPPAGKTCWAKRKASESEGLIDLWYCVDTFLVYPALSIGNVYPDGYDNHADTNIDIWIHLFLSLVTGSDKP